MVIAVPVIDKVVNGKRLISPHFGRAPFFLIYNDVTGSSMIVENPKCAGGCHSKGAGGGRFLAQLFMKNGVDAVLVKEIGEGAFSNMRMAGIKVYKIDDNVKFFEDAVSLYKEGKLEELNAPISQGHHHHHHEWGY